MQNSKLFGLKDSLVNDVTAVWNKASLTIVTRQRVGGQCKNVITKFEAARKRAKTRKSNEVSKERLQNLFDISKCKYPIEESSQMRNKIYQIQIYQRKKLLSLKTKETSEK